MKNIREKAEQRICQYTGVTQRCYMLILQLAHKKNPEVNHIDLPLRAITY